MKGTQVPEWSDGTELHAGRDHQPISTVCHIKNKNKNKKPSFVFKALYFGLVQQFSLYSDTEIGTREWGAAKIKT